MSDIFGSPGKTSSSNQTSSSSYDNTNSNSNSQSSSQSSNQAFASILQALQPQTNTGTSASNSLAALLGVGGNSGAQQAAFDNWKNSTGYQFGLDQGSQAITQNNAAKGLLNSGATAKALDTYGQNYANTQYQNYLNPLQSLIGSGTQAANAIGGVGNLSSSNSASNSQSTGNSSMAANGISLTDTRGANSGGAGAMLGNILGMIAK